MNRRNHIVPQVYLSNFVNEENKIIRYKINPDSPYENPISSPKPLKSVAFEYDLYTIENNSILNEFGLNPDMDQFIEDECFKSLENNLRRLIEGLINTELNVSDRQKILDFFIISVFRSPRIKSFFEEKYDPEFIIDQNRSKYEAIIEENNLNYTFEQIKISLINHLASTPNLSVENQARDYQQKSLIQLFLNIENPNRIEFNQNLFRNWTIYESIGELKFLTSNNPAFTHWGNAGFNNNLMPGSTFSLPLNPTNYLIIDGPIRNDNEMNVITKITVNDGVVDFMNFATIKGSEGELFSSDKSLLERYQNENLMNSLNMKYLEYVQQDVEGK